MVRNVLIGILGLFLLGFACTQKPEVTRVFLIGDSTMANKRLWDKPETGWGEVFSEFFHEKVEIHR